MTSPQENSKLKIFSSVKTGSLADSVDGLNTSIDCYGIETFGQISGRYGP